MSPEELSERQKFILSLVIHEFTRAAAPVGSRSLVENYHLDMSSATVRSEMVALTERGYLRQPHTSAGRVPSEEGYRYFVGRLLRETELPDAARRTISHQFYQMRQDVSQWTRLAASILAIQSRAASVVTAPQSQVVRFRHMELISTRGCQVLMILVLAGGEVHQRMLTLSESIPQEQLSAAADRISRAFQGQDFNTIRLALPQWSGLEAEVLGWMLDEAAQVDRMASSEIYVDGVSNVLSEPEFTGSEDARRAIQLLERHSLLKDLLAHPAVTSHIGGVHVLIGGEGTWEELRPFSMVLARYGAPGLATGTLGVLGPMRMAYGRTISTVRYLANLMSDLVTETMTADIPGVTDAYEV